MISISAHGVSPNSTAPVVRSPTPQFQRSRVRAQSNNESSRNMNLDAEQAHVRTNLDEYSRGADPDCARAMAEAENVLRELSLDALFRPQSSPGGSTADRTP